MAFIVPLMLGILLGVGVCAWERYRFKRQIKQVLTSLADTLDFPSSLPLTSLIRRTLNSLLQQQRQLETELQLWRDLLEKAPVGYLQVDEENQLLWCNQQARELLKIDRWQPGQLRLLLELVRSYELDRLIEQTRQSQTPQSQEWVFYPIQYGAQGQAQLSSPKSLTLKGSSYPLPQGSVGVFLENQQPLLDLSQSRDRLFSDLTHELQTPLTSIALVTETLQKRLENPERSWLEKMSKEINRLINLVQDWLELSQLQEAPNQQLHYQSLELRELIFTAWQSLQPLAQQKKLNLTYFGPDRLYLQGDQSRLTQVFINIFDNSIKNSPSQTAIRVEVETIPSNLEELSPNFSATVQINVIDWGCGFAEADLPHIFERLYRGESSRAREISQIQTTGALQMQRGSGLGLAIVREIIKAHGGAIVARNHPDTGGAWLQVTLPLGKS
jgi:two-component system phosphate regulon sensor histidine kinase PhoR